MPTNVQVKVNTVNHTTQRSNAGNELNYVEITGYDATNSKGFKKRFFATKKDGTATKNAETADSLNQDDWIQITLDDTSYHNVQTLKKIAQPAGMEAPSQSSKASGNPKSSGGKKGGFKKGGEFRTVPQLNREVALNAAVKFVNDGETKAASIDDVVGIAEKFENYLVGQTVDGEVREPLKNGGSITNPTKEYDSPNNDPQDDDIPF